jgi:hypothetical protein
VGALTPRDLVLGVLVLIAIGLIVRIPRYLGVQNRINRPLSITHFTKETPAQIQQEARIAFFQAVLSGGGAVLAIWAIVYVLDSEVAITVAKKFAELIALLLLVVAQILQFLADVLRAFV